MARIILPKFAVDPQNDGERRTIEFLQKNLSPYGEYYNYHEFNQKGPEYVIIPNLEIPHSKKNRYLEIDVLLVSPRSVFLIENKDWYGNISGNDDYWTLNQSKDRENPLKNLNYKAKILKTILIDEMPYLKKIRVESIIIISSESSVLNLSGKVANVTFKLDDNLLNYIEHANSDNKMLEEYQEDIVSFITNRASGRKRKQKNISTYQIIEELEKTEKSEVYIARSTIAGSINKLKRLRVFYLPVEKGESELQIIRNKFLRNYDVLESIGPHPYINPVSIESLENFMILEISNWSDKGNLREYMKNQVISFEEALNIIRKIAEALKILHQHNIFHRNLKPENILISSKGPQISNFDFAYIQQDKQMTVWNDEIISDRRYIAPELNTSMDEYDFYPSTDLYSLGVIFYEMLTKNIPFSGPAELIRAGGRLTEDLKLSVIRKDIPVWADAIIDKLYNANLEERYSDSIEMLEEIDQFIRKPENISSQAEKDPGRVFQEKERIGDYMIIEHIKSGAFSQVYKGLHILQGREYALKVYNMNISADSLIDEFAMLSELNHKNIVKVNWSGQLIASRNYIAMEYLNGESVETYIRGTKKLSISEIIQLAKDIISAIRYLHEGEQKYGSLEGIKLCHRDIKPENIIYVKGRGYILIDFNIARQNIDINDFSGTAPYLAPDIYDAANPEVLESSDTFALGVSLYELAFRKHPYPDERPSLVNKPIYKELESNKQLSDFIFKAVQPLHEHRFKSAREMEEELLKIENYIIEDNISKPEKNLIIENNISDNAKIIWNIAESSINFQLISEETIIPFSMAKSLKNEREFSKYILLKELQENARASEISDGIFVPFEEISVLNNDELMILELPEPYPYIIKINGDGLINDPDFKYKWGFYEHKLGKNLFAKRFGTIIKTENNGIYSLNRSQYLLSELIEKFNQSPEENKDNYFNHLNFSEIKKLAPESGAILDSYLENENVTITDKLLLDIRKNEEEIKLLPEINAEIDQNTFQKKFEKFPKARNFYTIQNQDGERNRIFFNKKQEEELNKVKEFRNFDQENKELLLFQPQEIFDADIFDLDLFSLRVKEIGLYKPRFYPFISEFKSEWIPGILIEESPENRKKILFDNQEILQDFKENYQTSLKLDKKTFEWQGVTIPIQEASEIIEVAEKQFLNKKVPLKLNNKKVLIIKENLESTEHTETNNQNKDENEFIHQYSVPPYLKDTVNILEHQKEGIAWLQTMFKESYSGALLADDMGLGKTLQLLSFIQWHKFHHNNDKKPYLIIAPISLLENWHAEIYKFFENQIPVLNLYANMNNHLFSRNNNPEEWQKQIRNFQKEQIVLTNYETVRKRQLSLCAVDWAVTILDEAQKVKTPGTLITNAVKALKSDFKIAASGTPIENSLIDLWCITDFAVPGLLGSCKDFANEFQNPLKENDIDLNLLGEKLRKKIGIHIKRRMKNDILDDLPPKIIRDIQREMPAVQKEYYKKAINPGNSNPQSSPDTNTIIKIINDLKNISDHPFLYDNSVNNYNIDELINSSAKLSIIIEIIQEIQKKDEKLIIFSERKEMQRLLAKVIHGFFGLSVSIINGDTPVYTRNKNSAKESRQAAIDRFQSKAGFNIIIVSQLAAGFGLNIVEANHVIHYSRHWNPSKEEQATDRVYRIGQRRNVHIYLPMAVSDEFKSFDLTLNELLIRKKSLATASLYPTQKEEVKAAEIFQNLYKA